MSRIHNFFLIVLICVLTIPSCVKNYTGNNPVVFVNYPDWIHNNLSEQVALDVHFHDYQSIENKKIRPDEYFNIGDYRFCNCDSLIVMFSDSRQIRLYPSKYLTHDKMIMPGPENCFEVYYSINHDERRSILTIDDSMKSYAH